MSNKKFRDQKEKKNYFKPQLEVIKLEKKAKIFKTSVCNGIQPY